MYKHQDVHDIQHQYFRKPENLTRGEAFRRFLWNPKTSECFGRTGTSWGKRHLPRNLLPGYINPSISGATRQVIRGRTLNPRELKEVVAELSNLELNIRFFSTFKLLLPI